MALVILCFIRSKNDAATNDSTEKQPSSSLRDRVQQMDFPGMTLLLPGVICLLLALQWGGTEHPWSNGRVVALLVIGPILLLGFAFIQFFTKDQTHVTVPMRVMQNRNIWGSALYGSCVVAAFFTMMYYVCISISFIDLAC